MENSLMSGLEEDTVEHSKPLKRTVNSVEKAIVS